MSRTRRENKLEMKRLIFGISNFGYTAEDAILDIIDNSIVAKAKNIEIIIGKKDIAKTDDKSVQYIAIIDDGNGMDNEQIFNALMLGSPQSDGKYETNSLSKYGFGLKSAGFSQAKRISVISRKDSDANWMKSFIDYNQIIDENDWVVNEEEELTELEKTFIEKITESGTIVLLTAMSTVNEMSNYVHLKKKLCEKISITYHRIMEESGTNFSVDGDLIDGYDPLFCKKAVDIVDKYNGSEPCRFFNTDKVITINAKNKSRAIVKAIQLPYPPKFKIEGKQKKYNSNTICIKKT